MTTLLRLYLTETTSPTSLLQWTVEKPRAATDQPVRDSHLALLFAGGYGGVKHNPFEV